MCESCVDKKDKARYAALPEVPMNYPCFANGEFIEDEDCMEWHIDDSEGVIPTEIYPAIKKTFSLDIIDFLDENVELEDPFSESLTSEQRARLEVIEDEINTLVGSSLKGYYDCDMKYRMVYTKETA